ncbi:hypothetical protein S4A8_00245 [Salinisphaera sp. S4-8]|uniref:sulfite exporter TauE/SafE family protein n=1 Tax=Salinisphaera sp. S4-8 TaxID=633357 RepID=UPI0033420FE4
MSVLFGVFIGLALGLTGGGGSIFAVPLLIYGLGLAAPAAIAVSLAAVAFTAAFGAIEAGWRGLIELRAGLIFAIAGMVSAPLGVHLGDRVSETVIVALFAAVMFVVAMRMFMSARRAGDDTRVVRARPAADADDDPGTVCRYSRDGRLRLNAPCSAALVAVGLVVGVMSGFFGVGGGFLIVPALMLITTMGIHRAVSTSLLVITLVGLSGLASAIVSGRVIDWPLTALFVLGGLIGMVGGRSLSRYLAGPALQFVFALAMICIAVFMLLKTIV